MLIGIDTRPCVVSLHYETGVCSAPKWHQNSLYFKIVCTKINFSLVFSLLSIPILVMGINGCYSPAICWVCFIFGLIVMSSVLFNSLNGYFRVSPAMLFFTMSNKTRFALPCFTACSKFCNYSGLVSFTLSSSLATITQQSDPVSELCSN